jgi:hypothetical protein
MEPKGLLPPSQKPAPVRILNQINPVHDPHLTAWRYILVLSFLLRLGLPCLAT